MTILTIVDRHTLERRLTVALSNLIVDDWRLLTTWTPTSGASGERAIAAALGWHIKSAMERSWDVDCEYNRTGSAEATEVKRWRAPNEGATNEQLPPTVTPDVIVHHRGLDGKANNLLVLELKKTDRTASQSDLTRKSEVHPRHPGELRLPARCPAQPTSYPPRPEPTVDLDRIRKPEQGRS